MGETRPSHRRLARPGLAAERSRVLRRAQDEACSSSPLADARPDLPDPELVEGRTTRLATAALSRRFVLAAAGSVLLLRAASARAEAPKILRVGYVGMQTVDAPIYQAFRLRMAELGYRAGSNFSFEYVQAPSVEA